MVSELGGAGAGAGACVCACARSCARVAVFVLLVLSIVARVFHNLNRVLSTIKSESMPTVSAPILDPIHNKKRYHI